MTKQTTDYEVRPPSDAELDQVQRLRHVVLDPARTVATDTKLGKHDLDPDYIHMAAFADGKIISTVRLNQHLKDTTYLVRKMATLPAFQGQGIGASVLRQAERIAVERGATDFILDSRFDAIGFYARLGYEQTGETVIHNDGIPNYTMVKQVTS